MPLPLSLPQAQNWSCHSCGNCCHTYACVVTPQEQQRILDQKWTKADGIPEGRKVFVRVGGPFSKRYRLAHKADSSCVFLDEHNRCKIHSKFGEAAKPLSCRIYPFGFNVVDGKAAVTLRFSCPSIAASEGATMESHRPALLHLRDEVVPDGKDFPPPEIAPGQQLDWPDTMRIIKPLRELLCESSGSIATPLVHALFIADMLSKATFEKVRGSRVDELMQALLTAAPMETQELLNEGPSHIARVQFRLAVAQYASRDRLSAGGIGYRLAKVFATLRFTRGTGTTPAIQPRLREVTFASLEDIAPSHDPQIDALMRRYFAMKLDSMAFCGLPCYGLPLAEGFASLALIYPVVMYLAKWVAFGEGRSHPALEDAQHALAIADHHHGYSPMMGTRNFRQRVRSLWTNGDLSRLVAHYGR